MSRVTRINSILALGVAVSLATQWRSLASIPNVPAAAWFVGAIVVMAFFDAELPNGDVVDMSTPIVAAATVTSGVATALIAVMVSRALVLALRREAGINPRIADAGLRAVFATALVGIMMRWFLPAGADSLSSAALIVRAAPLLLGFFALSFGAAQAQAAAREVRPLAVLVAGNLRLQGWFIASQLSVSILSVLVAKQMGPWGLAIVVLLLLVVTQAFSLLVDVRTAYRDTVTLLARAMEAENPERLAHAERVAHLASSTGREVGLQGQRLEWLTYAALFHDMDLMGTDKAETTQSMEFETPMSSPGSGVVGQVKFLEPIARILGIVNAGGETLMSQSEFDIIAAYIVARASEIDDALNERSGDLRRSDGVGRRLYADRRRELDSRIGRSATRVTAAAAKANAARYLEPR